MKKVIGLVALSTVFMLSGCMVRTYQMTRDRIDQDLSSGNRGYLQGRAPQIDQSKERPSTRTTQVVEVELSSPFKNKQSKKAAEPKAVQGSSSDNQGNVFEPIPGEKMETLPAGGFKEYKIGKNETLQKISQKFYGTTKKWITIYNYNKDVLKGPDKVRVGQVIKIPLEGMKEPKENLK